MSMSDQAKGWHPDSAEPGRWNYWDGRRWNGVRREHAGHASSQFSLLGWRRLWYGKIMRAPIVFYPLAWLNRSMPGVKGRFDRWMRPPQTHRP